MQKLSRYFKVLLVLVILVAIGFVAVENYSFIFKKTVIGRITGIDRVSQPTAILGAGTATPDVLFSFAVAIKDKSGEFFTASSEDRQWAVVKQGDCAEVIFYPYPPWNLAKAETYFNARLKKLLNCKEVLGDETPVADPHK